MAGIKDIMGSPGMFSSGYMTPSEQIRSLTTAELEQFKVAVDKEIDKRTLDTPLLGPTRRELLGDVTLKEAWNQLQCIRRLKGV